MSTINLLIIMLACITMAKADYHNITMKNITHLISDSSMFPTVLKARNHILYASYARVNRDVHVKLISNSLSPGGINKTCKFTVLGDQDLQLLNPTAAALGDGKIVMAFPEASKDDFSSDPEPYVRFYVVDVFKDCGVANFSRVYDNGIMGSYGTMVIVPYQSTFDVFAKSYKYCKPSGSICLIRYNEKGDSLGTLDFDFETSENNFDLVHISPIQEFSSSDGYVFISEHTTTIRTLNPNLKTTKELKLSGYIKSYSVLNGDISVCYHVYDPEGHDECSRFDPRLKIKANVTLSQAPHYLQRRIYNLADGSSLVISVSVDKVRTIVRKINADGRISEAEQFAYDCDGNVFYKVDHFLELKGGVYCFSFDCKSGTITHCAPPAQVRRLSSFS